ncbi:MAG TPA: chemotaxis protein CheW [Halothiobacillus sp.]|jgi:purine-binding chemotaxis protein CheW|nr:chemotaxis protein CheW [Halothiobacillus sp.]HQS28650.1 chemotaxis protein CheW [Halothiobacillus sp.]HUM98878.1 chemotaxis protein CheW [Halothiobacillus sp.]
MSQSAYLINNQNSLDDMGLEQGPAVISRWVTFTVADETYALNVLDVQEVLRAAEITPIPGAHPAVRGIINLRGNVVTILDARVFFALPEKPFDDDSRIMVAELRSGEVAGIVVDSVAEVIALDEAVVNAAKRTGGDEGSAHILGVVPQTEKGSDKLIILVDLKGLSELGEK